MDERTTSWLDERLAAEADWIPLAGESIDVIATDTASIDVIAADTASIDVIAADTASTVEPVDAAIAIDSVADDPTWLDRAEIGDGLAPGDVAVEVTADDLDRVDPFAPDHLPVADPPTISDRVVDPFDVLVGSSEPVVVTPEPDPIADDPIGAPASTVVDETREPVSEPPAPAPLDLDASIESSRLDAFELLDDPAVPDAVGIESGGDPVGNAAFDLDEPADDLFE